MTARILIVLFSFILVSCEKPAEPAKPYEYFTIAQIKNAADLRQTALTKGSGAYAILEGLVTTAGGRLAGSEGNAKGVAYMEAEFKALGFDKVWLEPVTIPGWERRFATAEVVGLDNLSFNVTSLGKSSSTPEGGVTAEVVRFKTYEDLVAADASEVAGKIVYISNHMARAQNGSGYGPAVIARARGHADVARKGGLALIIRSIGSDESDYPHTGAMSFEADGAKDVFAAATNGDAWSIAFGEKTVGAAALSNQDADVLEALLDEGAPVVMHVDIQNRFLGDVTTYNVIAEITGATRPDEIVVTGGHLDSWDLGTGAMDDGMGVATTTAAVKLIADLPERPARTIRVVAFAAEEIGIFGAFAYGAAHQDEDHVFGMESDFGLGKVWQLNPHVGPEAIPVVREAWRVVGPMGIAWNPDDSTLDGADLIPLAAAGMPGATLYGEGTYYFDYHHTAADQLDLIKAEDLDYNAAAYAAILYLAAEYDGRFGTPPADQGDE